MADACECICSYQWAMRRLMQILNQAQTYCTEDDCQDPQGQVRSGIHAPLGGTIFLHGRVPFYFNSSILNRTTFLSIHYMINIVCYIKYIQNIT